MLNGGVSQYVPKCPVLSPFVLFCPDLSPFRAPRRKKKRTNGDKTGHFGTNWETPPFSIYPHLALLQRNGVEKLEEEILTRFRLCFDYLGPWGLGTQGPGNILSATYWTSGPTVDGGKEQYHVSGAFQRPLTPIHGIKYAT